VVGARDDSRPARGRGAGGRRALIRIVAVGRPRGPLADAAHDYEARLGRALKLEVVEVRDEPLQRGTPEEVRDREGRRLLPHLDGCHTVLLDRTGRAYASEELAVLLQTLEERPPQRTAFVIGGACGVSPAVLAAAGTRLSLGPLTLPHQLARVVLGEQLYRATTILRGEPYHR
jgi:23S rRNA (pseudouridine1915-N3)-methyltransferase